MVLASEPDMSQLPPPLIDNQPPSGQFGRMPSFNNKGANAVNAATESGLMALPRSKETYVPHS